MNLDQDLVVFRKIIQMANSITKKEKKKVEKEAVKPTTKKATKSLKLTTIKKKAKASLLDAPSKKIVIADIPTEIRKVFEEIKLIPHPITSYTEHPAKFNRNNQSVVEINGIGRDAFYRFYYEGIFTIEDFVNAGVAKISRVLGRTEKTGLSVYLKGLAVYQNRVIQIKEPKKISKTPIYLDIETDIFKSRVWMIGIYISKNKEFIQLVADKRHHEPKIIKQCLSILSEHNGEPIISYSGSRFDERILRKRFDEELLEHSHLVFDDILLDIRASYAFPLKAYTLGGLGDFYGYNFKHPNMDGLEVANLYLKHSHDLKKFRGYKKLCDYNEDDVKSLAALVEQIYLK